MDINTDLIWGFILNGVFAIIIFFVGKWIAGLLRELYRKIMQARNVDPVLVSFTSNIVYAVLW